MSMLREQAISNNTATKAKFRRNSLLCDQKHPPFAMWSYIKSRNSYYADTLVPAFLYTKRLLRFKPSNGPIKNQFLWLLCRSKTQDFVKNKKIIHFKKRFIHKDGDDEFASRKMQMIRGPVMCSPCYHLAFQRLTILANSLYNHSAIAALIACHNNFWILNFFVAHLLN